jgi:ubiquinone/menaquinone biosynthesis C-methylase UbiE
MVAPSSLPDLAAAKAGQRQAWAAGDYARFAAVFVPLSERFCDAADLRAGQRVLDVATGSGNTAIAAARRFCAVTGVDYVPALLARARERAAVEGLAIEFREGDAEALPFADASFDAVLSTFGTMFAPDQQQAARELLRVCRPGGTIALANWTPEGLVGEILRAMGRHLPPPPAMVPSPLSWGTEARLCVLFGDRVAALAATRRIFVQRYPSVAFYVDFVRTHYGPTLKAFEALGAAGQTRLAESIAEVATRFNCSGDDTLVMHAEYLEVVATRR